MNMTRRDALRTMGLAAAAAPLGFGVGARADEVPEKKPPHQLPALSFAYDALEPHIDARTMEIHYTKHHAGYVRKLNAAIADDPELESFSAEELITGLNRLPESIRTSVRNNGGGHVNHTLFWDILTPGGAWPDEGPFSDAISASFGSMDPMLEQIKAAGLGVFGSGWVWLVRNRDGSLSIETTPNQDNPLMKGRHPVFGIDVWEHAYYLKYQNRRAEYLDNILKVVDWRSVDRRYAGS